jgi:hypothetical protein
MRPMSKPALAIDSRNSRHGSARFWSVFVKMPARVRTTVHRIAAVGSVKQSVETEWDGAIRQAVEELENLNRCTERDFLAVGERLAAFRSTARSIASDMAAVSELISGEHGRKASQALTEILEYSTGMNARIAEGGQALEQVRDLSGRVRQAFGGLRNTVSVFRALCTLTRIETSRLGSIGADFRDLAAEVTPLSESIQSSGEGVMEASHPLDASIQSAIRGGADLRVRQLKDLPALLARVINDLQAFDERRREAVESSALQATQYTAVCDAVDDLVRSVQFHDITRQQIEHVIDALRILLSARAGVRKVPRALPPDTRAVLIMQSSQLSAAAQIFASSLEHIQCDLESIAVRVQDMAETSRALMGISENDQSSFFLQMEDHFTVILKMLDTCTGAQTEMASMAGNLEQTIGKMRESVAQIRRIEIRIQRIANNAIIGATHIGAAGNALNVIAEVMHRLAVDSNANTENVSATLHSMSDAAKRVSAGSYGAASDTHPGTDKIIGDMRRMVVELHASSENGVSRVNQIAAMGARLAAEIAEVRGGLSAGLLFADVVDRVREKLKRIEALDPPGSLEGQHVAPTLENLAKTYTMQIQREVHESVVGGTRIPMTVPAETGVTAPKESELGDNVELF